jgi:transposase
MSAATLFTGLDLHKRTLVATTLNATGEQVAHAKLPCHPEALRYYFARQNGADTAHRAVVEATGSWAIRLAGTG